MPHLMAQKPMICMYAIPYYLGTVHPITCLRLNTGYIDRCTKTEKDENAIFASYIIYLFRVSLQARKIPMTIKNISNYWPL
jgi:hypothetical protein